MNARVRQTTLRGAVSFSGVGVHTGRTVGATIKPAKAGTGYVFTRAGAGRHLKAVINNIGATELCTTLRVDDFQVATVEHILAALSGLEIDNAAIEVNGPEIPALDGSATPFASAIREVGAVQLSAPRRFIRVLRPFRVDEGSSFAELRPYDGRRFEVEIEYRDAVIGRQRFTADLSPASFAADIAHARTFGFLREVEILRTRGFARGASLENAVVVGDDGVLNNDGLRFADEFARHKMLDAIGDLALAGAPILGFYRSYRGGHTLNAHMVEAFLAASDAWEFVEAERARPERTPDRIPVGLLEPELT